MSSKKILAFTGIRSDYDLMSGLYKKIHNDPNLELGLIVSGAHLSPTYGYTVQNIEKDGLPIVARIESLIDSNSKRSRIKSASILLQNCIDIVSNFSPDLIIYPGDREDVIVGGLVGTYMGIPTIHFFGGDHSTDGNVDNPIRHATSKLSSLHFVTHESHKQRLISMGETEEKIYVVGNPALDKFINTPIRTKRNILDQLGCSKWDGDYALMIFHPIMGYEEKSGEFFEEILSVLKEKNIKTLVSYPNSDAGNRRIINVIDKYKNDENFYFYKNLDRITFINLFRNATFMIGNSSAGLLEAPTIPLGVVNVGERQKGRLAAENVIFVDQGKENIRRGIREVCSEHFQKKLKMIISPYGEEDSIEKAYKVIKEVNLNEYQRKWEDPLK
jgi:GDP/UDP-N,N'-diacetylbacillosamine 2-epimerase (hydrolysing)